MADKTDGKVFWETKDGDRRLMVSWQAKNGETKIPMPKVEAKIIPLMLKMKVDEANVKFDLVSGNPRNIEFVDAQAADEAKKKVEEQAKIQQKNAEEFEQSVKPIEEKTATMEKLINTNYSKDFHNPYNFVPATPRGNVTGELADREPIGHDRFYQNHLSGKLTVKMTVETPLVVLDTARVEMQGDHKKFPVRVDADGKPFINPTAVKGMLLSAYEAVTNSRMSVFTKHEDRLAFRMESTEGAMSVPARIANGKIVLYTGTTEISDYNGKPLNEDKSLNGDKREKNATLCAAWLPLTLKANIDNVERFPRHNEKFFAWLEKIQHFNKKTNNPDFKYWRVRKLAGSKSDLGNHPNKSNNTKYHESLGEFIDVEGYVCNTGENIKNKHDDRLFFINGRKESEIIKIDFDSETHGKALEDLIKNYRKEHSEKNGELSEPPSYEDKWGKKHSLEWSRQILRTEFNETTKDAKLKLESIENSPLCYVRVKNINNKWIVDELYPVTISRRLHQNSPADLLDSTLKPAKLLSQLSPADRVFGWVGDGVKKNGNYRGQVRFGSVVCKTDNAIEDFNNLPLNILGQPKPQQGRFYVAEDDKGKAQTHQRNNENAGYKKSEGRGLRGRKVYPHHASLPTDYWQNPMDANLITTNPKFFKEYRRPPKAGQEQRDSQNRSIQGWISPQTEFEFDIHFTNLSEVELGALVWLLSMDEKHFHRFGGGKPLGFGSVKLSIENPEITNGEDLKAFYTSLDKTRNQSKTPEECKTEFEKVANQDILNSFQAACKGFSTGLPIHYPRARQFKEDRDRNVTWVSPKSPNPLPPHSEGLAYEWFVANNKNGKQNVLPNISEDKGLPILDHKKTGG